MKKCRAAIGLGNGTFLIDEITVGAPGPDEVMVQMKAAGMCHTDYDSLSWGKPVVLGHEGTGIIQAVGINVQSVKTGDRVLLNWATPCMECFQCNLGNQHICEQNSPVVAGANGYTPGHAHLDGTKWKGQPIERSFNLGTFSEFCIVKESACVKIAHGSISDAAASIIGCGVMTGYGSVVNTAKVLPDSSVVVLGTGGVGLNVVQAARMSGAAMVIAVDIKSHRLEMALQFGATHTIQATREDRGLQTVAKEVYRLTDGRGADYAFECTAIPELGAAPLAMIRNAGMAVQVSGIEQEIKIDMNLFEWDKIYINPLYGQCQPQRDFLKIIAAYEAGKLKLNEMITRTYKLDQLQEAFEDMLSGKNAKGVIIF